LSHRVRFFVTTPQLSQQPLGELLAAIGAKTPAPGGGAVASLCGALAAALAKMVVAYSLGKKSLAEHQPALERSDATLARTVDMLLELAREDAEAYGLVNELSKLPTDDARRVRELPAAKQAAVHVPQAVVGVCADLLRLLESMTTTTNRHLRSDLAIAAILAEAGARAAYWNVRVNLASLDDMSAGASIKAECRRLLSDSSQRAAAIQHAIERMDTL
jgi:methenyltetrahydrofolate cyclohydrolase